MRETAVSAACSFQYIGYRWNNAYVAAALAAIPTASWASAASIPMIRRRWTS